MWTATRAFDGVIAGVEQHFAPGDQIPDEQAKEMGLASKPDIATKNKKVTNAQTSKP